MAQQGTFVYSNPLVIHWGAGSVTARLDQELERLGARRIFLVPTRSVAAHPALAGALSVQLGDRLVGMYAAIGQHAPAGSVAEAARPDTLLSFGGSPIDAAKAVAFVLATGLHITAPARRPARRAPPHLAIPTTLSVSELSSSAGCSTEGNREAVGLRAPPPARGPRCLSQSASAWSRPR